MLRFVLVDNIKPALAADNFIVWTDFLDASTHFHADHAPLSDDSLLIRLSFAIGDSSLRKIVRGQLDRNAVPGYYADKMFPHLTGDMSYNFMAVLKFYSKLSPRKGLDNGAREFDYFLVSCHKYV